MTLDAIVSEVKELDELNRDWSEDKNAFIFLAVMWLFNRFNIDRTKENYSYVLKKIILDDPFIQSL